MNRSEANYAESLEGSTPFEFPDDEQEIRAEADRRAIGLCQDAIGFVIGVVAKSRTSRAALIRLSVIQSMFGGPESSREIAQRFRVSPRLVQRIRKEIKAEFFGRKFAS